MQCKLNLNVNGGGDVAQYYLSASHNNDTGLLKVDPLNNFNNNIDINLSNLRANINIDLTKTTEIAVKFNSLFERYNGPISDAGGIFGICFFGRILFIFLGPYLEDFGGDVGWFLM